jgi:hypothetical protein
MSHAANNHKRSNSMTAKKSNAGFHTIALAHIHESTTNPGRTFDESKLAEVADYVPRHIISLLFRSSLCGGNSGETH